MEHETKEARNNAPRLISRRRALKYIGGGLALGAVYLTGCSNMVFKPEKTTTQYQKAKIAKLSEIKPNTPVEFSYPLKAQQNFLIDMGKEVAGGVGPHKSIVAFNRACQHMGCPVTYDKGRNILFCGCHQTVYDPSFNGIVVVGQGKASLPRIKLIVENDDIYAVGVEGLIYGYRNNVMDGERV